MIVGICFVDQIDLKIDDCYDQKRMFMSFVVKTILDDSSQIDMDYKQDGFEKFVIDFSLNHSASQYLLSEDRLFVTGEKSNVNYSNNRDDYFDCDIIYFFSYECSGYTTIENEEFPIVTHDKSFLELIDCANSRIQNKSIKWIKAKRVLSTISKSISAMAKSIKTNFFIWVALVFCLAMVVAIIGSLSLFFFWLISLIYVDVSVMFFIPTTIISIVLFLFSNSLF